MELEPIIPNLFELGDIETKSVIKACSRAHRALGELKGIATSMPNPNILLGTLPLQEAKDSSEIENIVTTQDDLYRSNYEHQIFASLSAKEVHRYAQAMSVGFSEVKETGMIKTSTIQAIQRILENNDAGFRKQSGTRLMNTKTGTSVYTPPQNPDQIKNLMDCLVRFINDSEGVDYDPLVKMALIHHQFESIHPFYDANGRTGRILNILYLVLQGVLDTPILYLSRYINRNRTDYYRLLQATRDTNSWEDWLLFMIGGIEETSIQTIRTINAIKNLMAEHKILIKGRAPKIYSHELINNLYQYPYTKVDFVARDCGVHHNTALHRLSLLVNLGILERLKYGKTYFYVNKKLFSLLSDSTI